MYGIRVIIIVWRTCPNVSSLSCNSSRSIPPYTMAPRRELPIGRASDQFVQVDYTTVSGPVLKQGCLLIGIIQKSVSVHIVWICSKGSSFPNTKGKKLFLKSTLEVTSFHIYVTNIYVDMFHRIK